MGDPRFAETVILLLEHGREGTLGVVINQPSDVPLHKAIPALPDARRSEVSVYWGGPVQPEQSIVLLREPGDSRLSKRVLPGVHMSPDLDDLRDVLAAPRPDRAVRVYSGYAGWGPGQLVAEMQKRQWVIDEGDADLVFAPDPTPLWERVHTILARREARMGPPPARGASVPAQ
jgi:putative transcriptional regulator